MPVLDICGTNIPYEIEAAAKICAHRTIFSHTFIFYLDAIYFNCLYLIIYMK